jgi:deazaflavin-dependent oxidoreductase (nitroreductase family)
VLSHTGARSAKRRQTSLYYCEDGPNLAVIASKVGAPGNPSWYTNLVANPNAKVQIGRQRRPVRARLADEAERARIWQRMASIYPGYEAYQRRTERRIPVVILEPIAAAPYSSEEA